MATFARGYWTRRSNTTNEQLRKDLQHGSSQTLQIKVTWIVTAGNEQTLRGIPAIGRGVAGAIPGTNPNA